VLPKAFRVGVRAATSVFATAQQPAPTQVKVHVLNVCTPSREEPKEIAGTLARVLKPPIVTPDFEVARGHSPLWDDDALEDSAVGVTSAAAIVGSTTLRVTHIGLERFEKPIHNRGGIPEKLFISALIRQPAAFRCRARGPGHRRYYTLLQARQTVPGELAKVPSASVKSETNPRPATRRTGRS
jgi:hypothetical protein